MSQYEGITSTGQSVVQHSCSPHDAPDIETASADYATRFSGKSGAYLLSVQDKSVLDALQSGFGDRVLEVGGGHGQLRHLYGDAGVSFVLHGSDEACFERLESPKPQEGRVVSDLRTLPFDAKCFDTVIAVRLLCHVEVWSTVLTEMCRVSSDRVLFDFPTSRSLNGLTPLLFGLKKGVEKNTRTYESFVPRDFEQVLSREGFRVVRMQRQFFFPMVVHRLLGGNAISRFSEACARFLGLTRLFGSPVVLMARRVADPVLEKSGDMRGD